VSILNPREVADIWVYFFLTLPMCFDIGRFKSFEELDKAFQLHTRLEGTFKFDDIGTAPDSPRRCGVIVAKDQNGVDHASGEGARVIGRIVSDSTAINVHRKD
jgi:hypothetical protein